MTASRTKYIITTLVAAAVIAAIIAAIVVVTSKDDDDPAAGSPLGEYKNAAISANAPECAQIGRNILQQNGTVADAAIATLLCVGVIHSQSMGVGGGFFMVYYNRTEEKSYALNAREAAPEAATVDMFEGNSTWSSKGGLAVAVPGELKGYWEIYQRFGGGVKWETLFEPTIEICEKGYKVDTHTANALKERRNDILNEPSMYEVFVDPKTKDIYQLGDSITRPKFAETLRKIANDDVNGGNLLYQRESDLSKWLVEDLAEFGGIMTMEDMENYKVNWTEPIVANVSGGFTVHTMPPPGSGALLAFIMRVLSEYDLTSKSVRASLGVTEIHLIVEAFKHAYAKRTILGDPFDDEIADVVHELVYNLTESTDYLDSIHSKIKMNSTSQNWEDYGAEFYTPEDHGTSHVSIVGPNGDAIAITSTVNLYFGAKIRSKRTGIIYNDEMDDFSAPNITNSFGVPPSPNNFIKPGKRPFSSMSPSIFTDVDGDVRLVVGAAGGTRITTATTYVAIRNLWFNDTIKDAIDAPRIHHQLAPMELQYEKGLDSDWIEGLGKIGHKMAYVAKAPSVTMGAARSANGKLWAHCDFRVACSIDGF